MLRCCGVFVLFWSLAQCGFVGVLRDHVVEEDDVAKIAADGFETKALKAEFSHDMDLERDLLSGSKNMVVPLLTGVIVKVLTLLPIILTTLAVIAGFSLAASKVALLLGGGLMLYHYLSEIQFLLPVASNKGSSYAESASFHPLGLVSHPEMGGYTRDRTLDLSPSQGI